MSSAIVEKLVGYLFLGLLAAGAVWKLNSLVADHYQAPVKQELKAAEESRDAWQAAAKDEKTKRDALSAQLLAREKSDREINAKLTRVANDLEQLKNQQPDVKVWADSPVPIDVIRLRLESPTATTPATPARVQGGSRTETAGGSASPTDGGGDEPVDVESDVGAGSSAGEVQPTAAINSIGHHDA